MDISKNHLSEEQIELQHQFCGTEPPFSGELLNEREKESILVLYAVAYCLILIQNMILALGGQVF